MVHPSLDDARAVLLRYFGYPDFRAPQLPAIRATLSRRDALIVLPTGGGKSICFQVPALVLGGLTVVISPLVALMQDQVEALTRRQVGAATLNSLMSREEQGAVLERIGRGELSLLYVSPERAPSLALELLRRGIRPRLLAVDEAHCITEWGHDFRPSYRQLARIRTELGRPPVVALTGSATQAVREDIISSLQLSRPDLHLASFDRPNLRFEVELLKGTAERLPRTRELLAPKQGIAIVYVTTRNSADAVAQALWFAGHRSAPYHAGLTRERRAEVLQRFVAEELDVVVATSAFGMGIDAPRVRQVIHWGMSPTPEAYYQEAGRAGRDGQEARCILLHQSGDAEVHRRQLEVTFPPRRVLEELWADPDRRSRHPAAVVAAADRLRAELGADATDGWQRVARRKAAAGERLRTMERYAGLRRCRRRLLLEYFGELNEACAGCDVCTARPGASGRRGGRSWFGVF